VEPRRRAPRSPVPSSGRNRGPSARTFRWKTAAVAPSLSPSQSARPGASPSRSPAASPTGGQRRAFYVTFYGAAVNTPPGSRDIAYPTAHRQAGGTGTYRDPITLATDRTEVAVGTVVYYAPLRRYFVMEDSCTDCEEEWRGRGPAGGPRFPHIDLWTGTATDDGIIRCENSLTRDGQSTVLVDPPPNLPVSPGPLYDGRTCFRP